MDFDFYYVLLGFFSKYASLIPFKDKESIPTNNAFKKILDESKCTANKIWVDKGNEFYNRLMKSFFQDNDIERYSLYNQGKSVIAEKFIRTLKNEFIHMWLQKMGSLIN